MMLAGSKVHPKDPQLARALALLAGIARDSSDAILCMDPEGIIQSWNAAAESLLGYSAGEALGQTCSIICPPEGRDRFLELMREIERGGHVQGFETAIVRKDGSPVDVSLSISPIWDETGRIIGSATTISDIAERRRLEEGVSRSKGYLDGVINSILDPVFVKDEQHRWAFLNDAFCKFLGFDRAQLIGKSDYDFLPRNEAEVFWHKDSLVLATGEENVSDEEFTDARGITHSINTRKSLFVGATGEKYIVGCIRDLTANRQMERVFRKAHDDLERKVDERTAELSEANQALTAQVTQTQRALEALRKSEQRYRRVVDHILDALLVDDAAGRVVYANDRFLELFGLTRDDIPNLSLEDYVAPEWRPALRDRHDRRIRGEEVPVEFTYEGIRKDGSHLWLQAVVTPIVEDGRVVGTQSVTQDITERRRAERLQSALYRIVELARSAEDLQKLYASIHAIVGELIYAKNCYIALYDRATDMVSFPYFVDEKDPPAPAHKFGRGLTEYVLRTGQPLLGTAEKLNELVRQGELFRRGTASLDWMGAPLKSGDQTVGALVLQSYEPIAQYGEAEKEILMIVSQQIAAAIESKRNEAAIRESESKFRAVAETSPTLILVSDGVRIFYVNPAAEAASGYSREELLAMDPWMLMAEEYRPKMMERAQARLRGEPIIGGYEFPILTKSGEERWLGFRASSIEYGGKTAILGSAEDITERKRAEQLQSALYSISEQAAAAEDLPQFFASLHAIVGKLMFARNFYIALSDSASGTVSFPYFVDEEDVTPIPKKLGKGLTEFVLRTGEPLLASPEVFEDLVRQGEVEALGAPSVDWLGVPLKFGTDTIGALVVQSYTESVRFNEKHKNILTFVSQNIAAAIERKRSAEALRQSEARYRRQVENAVYGIFRASVEDRFLEVNPALVAMLGYGSIAEVLLLRLSRDLYVNPEELAEIIQSCRHQDRIGNMEVRWKRKGSLPFTVRLSGRVVRDLEGEVESLEMIAEDVTERWMLEQQLLQSQKMEAVGRLAGGIAHDFNNLLTIIKGYNELMREQIGPKDPWWEATEEIGKAADRSASLTRQLLAFSRKQVLEPKILNLSAVITNLATMLQRLLGEDVVLATALGDDLGRIKADPGQIEQVVMNLAVNARDAMPRGGQLLIATSNVTVDNSRAREHAELKPGHYVLMEVSDTGVGMDAATVARIFDPFFTTKALGRGTGLGLATVYGIVKQSEGYIWVDSELGSGTAFKVYLPRVNDAEVDIATPASKAESAKGTETILVVEDEDGLRMLVAEMLRRFGYTVFETGLGEDALLLCGRDPQPFHLLLTDVVLPQMNGRELAERVTALHPGVKVLYMSGHTSDAVLRRGIERHKAAFLEKPFSLDALVQKVREVLDSTQPG
jgi:PAS domain S-box-containing protein